MLMQMLGAFAKFEREMIRERTRAGLREARTRGRALGRKPKITVEQKKEIVEAVASGRKTAAEIARLFKSTQQPSRGCSLRRASGYEPRRQIPLAYDLGKILR
jgi:DNA invertase Pin-like site-specific DNA recombinase